MTSKMTMLALLCGGLLVGSNALADNHTVSVGYAQSKVEDFKKISVASTFSIAMNGSLLSV